MSTETIAAISTGGTNSGISIIRISGQNAKKIIDKIFINSNKLEHQKIIYGKIVNNGNIVDEVLVSYFVAPNSYTGEDVCEINCHGGRKIALEILDIVISSNLARLAEPGEFSKRAFLNGKMDLSKAEAIIDLINAKTTAQTKIAVKQLEGSIKTKIEAIKQPLVETIANIEVGIDYPEYEYEELSIEQIKSKMTETINNIENLISTYNQGKYLKNGINVGIVGSPNSGKSSLLNVLSNTDKAIVTEIEGTTRDVVEEKVIIDNLELNLYDTAGIRDTSDVVEKIGINKSLQIIDEADIVLLVIDCTKKISKQDTQILNLVKEKGKQCIICINKIDISHENNTELFNKEKIVKISTKTGEGIAVLEDEISRSFDILKYNENEENVIINERHKDALIKAKNNLLEAVEQIENGTTIELVTINITEALENINTITGESASENIINKIFEKFCLGK